MHRTNRSADSARSSVKQVTLPYLLLPCATPAGSGVITQSRNYLAATAKTILAPSLQQTKSRETAHKTKPITLRSTKKPEPKQATLDDVLAEALATALRPEEKSHVLHHITTGHHERVNRERVARHRAFIEEAKGLRITAAVFRIQKWWRETLPSFIARQRWKRNPPSATVMDSAASRIQLAWYAYQYRQRHTIREELPEWLKERMLKRLRDYRARKQAEQSGFWAAATGIQAVWRGHIARKAASKLRQHLYFERMKRHAAIQLQRTWRGYHARREYHSLRVRWLAATVIQATFRRFAAMKKYDELKSIIALPTAEATVAVLRIAENLHEKWVEIYRKISKYKQDLRRYHLRVDDNKRISERYAAKIKKVQQAVDDEEKAMELLRLLSQSKQKLTEMAKLLWDIVRTADVRHSAYLKAPTAWFKLGLRGTGRLTLRVQVDITTVLAQLFDSLKSKITSRTPIYAIQQEFAQKLSLMLASRTMKFAESQSALAASKALHKKVNDEHEHALAAIRDKGVDFSAKYRALDDLEDRLDRHLRLAHMLDVQESQRFYACRPQGKIVAAEADNWKVTQPSNGRAAAIKVIAYEAADSLHGQWKGLVAPFLTVVTTIRAKRHMLVKEIEAEFPHDSRAMLGPISSKGPLGVSMGMIANPVPDLHARVGASSAQAAEATADREDCLDQLLLKDDDSINTEEIVTVSRREQRLTRLLQAATKGKLAPAHILANSASKAVQEGREESIPSARSTAGTSLPDSPKRGPPTSPHSRLHTSTYPVFEDAGTVSRSRGLASQQGLASSLRAMSASIPVQHSSESAWEGSPPASSHLATDRSAMVRLLEADRHLLSTPRVLRSVLKDYKSRMHITIEERVREADMCRLEKNYSDYLDPPLVFSSKQEYEQETKKAHAPFVGPIEQLQLRDEELEHLAAVKTFPSDVLQYTADDVAWWIAKIGLGRYQQNFEATEVNGTVLSRLTEHDLVAAVGVTDRAHAMRICVERDKLMETSSVRMLEKISGHSIARNVRNAEVQSPVNTIATQKVFKAARDGRLAIVTTAVNSGFDVDTEDTNGDTLLITAVRGGHKRILDLVISRGCDVNYTNRAQETALSICLDPATKISVDPDGSLAKYLRMHGARTDGDDDFVE